MYDLKNALDKATEMWYNGGGRPHSLALLRRTPYASSSRLEEFASLTMKSALASSCLHSHSLGCPRTSVLRYTSCGCVFRAAQGSRTRARTSVLRYLAIARLCSDYRPALAAVRLLVYVSRKPYSANESIAPTITNTSVSAQATTPTEDSLCKGE